MRRRAAALPARNRQTGFTLIELMIVVVLLGVAATLLLVRWQPATDAARLRSATLEIEAVVRTAQHWSRQARLPAWIRFDGVGHRVGWQRAEDSAAVRWSALRGLRIVDAGYMHSASAAPTASDAASAQTIRINATGMTAPWFVELQAGARPVRLEHDGFSRMLRATSTDGLTP